MTVGYLWSDCGMADTITIVMERSLENRIHPTRKNFSVGSLTLWEIESVKTLRLNKLRCYPDTDMKLG